MKLLIRTVTIATVGLFIIVICLHSMIVETVKNSLDVAAISALNRTIDAYIANDKLKLEGDDNLYFSTDSEYYYYFYDSLLVQLNGYVSVDVMCNNVDVETGDLDVDITVKYRGLDTIDRTHTVHVDTYGRIELSENMDDYHKNLLREINRIEVGKKVSYGGRQWITVSNDTENLVILLDENGDLTTYGSTDYKKSSLKTTAETIVGNLDNKYKEILTETTMDGFNTVNGFYTPSGNDTFVSETYIMSSSEAIAFKNSIHYDVTAPFWCRDLESSTTAWVLANDGLKVVDINDTAQARPVIKIPKNKIETLYFNEAEDIYEIDID